MSFFVSVLESSKDSSMDSSSEESSCSSQDEQDTAESTSTWDASSFSVEPPEEEQAPPPHPTDKERQMLLLMLLAQVCALHDPTPRTFTVHVLELFERGILDREYIQFLHELGLAPRIPPPQPEPLLLLENGPNVDTAVDDAQQLLEPRRRDLLRSLPAATVPLEETFTRAQEASAIRSHLEGTTHSSQPKYKRSASAPSSWAVEHHPLSLSRYQREFSQKSLLSQGSFGQVFHVVHLMDGKDYAMKRVTFGATGYSKDSVTQAVREVQCLAQCHHAHCVRYYTSWLEPSWMTGSAAREERQLSLTDDATQQDSASVSRACSWAPGTWDEDDLFASNEWSQSISDDKDKKNSPSSSSRYRYEICLFIQMELCQSFTLADWVRQQPGRSVEAAIRVFTQLVSGIAHVHEKGILHRDLKPANVFLGKDDIYKVGDFGLSTLLLQQPQDVSSPTRHAQSTPGSANGACRDPLTAGVGTATYTAPEQLESRNYGPEADVFSLGLILLELCSHFGTEHERIQTFHDCRRGQVPTWLSRDYPHVASLILKCTHATPRHRPTANELLQLLEQTNTLQDDNDWKRQLEEKDKKLEEQRLEIAEKDRMIANLQSQVERLCMQQQLSSRLEDGQQVDGNVLVNKMETLGAVESHSLSDDDDY